MCLQPKCYNIKLEDLFIISRTFKKSELLKKIKTLLGVLKSDTFGENWTRLGVLHLYLVCPLDFQLGFKPLALNAKLQNLASF